MNWLKRWWRKWTGHKLPAEMTFTEIRQIEETNNEGKPPAWDEEEFWHEQQ